MTDMVNHPPHYKPLDGVTFDCITVTRDMTFNAGNAVKYMWRADNKNGRQDVEKARWYINDAIRYGDPVFIGSAWGKWHNRMTELARAQTDPHRCGFFLAIRGGLMESALRALNEMLGDEQ